MTKKHWIENGNRGIDNSTIESEPTNLKLSGEHYKKMDRTQNVDYVNKNMWQF